MSTQTLAVEANTSWWYRVGGLSAIALGISYIIITVVYSLGGALPEGAEEWLVYLAGHTAAWWAILGLSVFTDLLFIPVAVSLYIALKDINQRAILAGSGLLVLFVILDLAVTWPNYGALIHLSSDYAMATSEFQQAALIGAASYATSVLTSNVFTVYAILVPSVGIFIIGWVMLSSVFNRITAYLGFGAGILGMIAVVGPIISSTLGIFAVFSSILTTLWVLLAGYTLVRLGGGRYPKPAIAGETK